MKFTEILGVAWEGLSTNKVRSLLTMLGVIIGVAAVIIMMAVSAGTEATISDQINNLGANLLFISPNMSFSGATAGRMMARSSLVYDDVEAIAEKVPGVEGVSVEQRTSETVKYDTTAIDDVVVVGTTSDFPSVREVEMATGRFFSATDLDQESQVAVLGASLAKSLFGNADPVGSKITVGSSKFTIIGVAAERGVVGNEDWDSRLYIPITILFSKFMPERLSAFLGNSVSTIYVQVADPDNMSTVMTQITLLLIKRHDVTADTVDFTIQTQDDIITAQGATTAAFRSLLGWVAGVSLLVGGIGIMNIMLVSVTERTREIGVRQAVGATRADVRRQFLSEALMLSLVGGLLGVIGGVGGSWLFAKVGDMRTVVVPSSIVLAFTSAAVVGIFFGYYPASKAAQLDPIESLRHE